MEVTVKLDRLVQRFPKGHQYALGTQLRAATLDLVTLVARANNVKQRHLAYLFEPLGDSPTPKEPA